MPSLRSLMSALAMLALVCAPLSSALAAKGPPKLKRLQGLVDEVRGTAELTDPVWKAIKAVDQCAVQDDNWERAMRPELQTPIDSMFELLASGVVCWQSAETKLGKSGSTLEALSAFAAARARYVEAMRGYFDAYRAKAVGDNNQTCKRFKVAVAQAAASIEATAGLPDRFSVAENKTLALEVEAKAAGLAGLISSEYVNQNCD